MSSESEEFEFYRGPKPPSRGVTCDLWCPFLNSDELFQSKVMCQNLVRIGWAFQELSLEFSRGGGGRTPYWGCYMWSAMPIFGLGRAIPVKSHMWKFSSDWLSLSRAIVSTKISLGGGGEETPIREGYIWPVMPIIELRRAIPVRSHV